MFNPSHTKSCRFKLYVQQDATINSLPNLFFDQKQIKIQQICHFVGGESGKRANKVVQTAQTRPEYVSETASLNLCTSRNFQKKKC